MPYIIYGKAEGTEAWKAATTIAEAIRHCRQGAVNAICCTYDAVVHYQLLQMEMMAQGLLKLSSEFFFIYNIPSSFA